MDGKITEENIEIFKNLYSVFQDIAEKIAQEFASVFKIQRDFIRISLRASGVFVSFVLYHNDYYDGEDTVDCIKIDYSQFLLDHLELLNLLVAKKREEIAQEKKEEEEEEEREKQKEVEKELRLYKELKKKFEPLYAD